MTHTRTATALLLGMLMFTSRLQGDPGQPRGTAAPAADTAKDSNKWMQIKLHSSQQILAALTEGDLAAVENDARRLLVFNLLESWINDKDFTRKSDYKGQLHAFEFAAKELVRNAQANDLDGALNSYVLLTRSCVECHKLIRDVPAAK